MRSGATEPVVVVDSGRAVRVVGNRLEVAVGHQILLGRRLEGLGRNGDRRGAGQENARLA